MALFRKNTTTNIPELQEYYANQKRESTGLAWLLALGSLLVTAALIIGLFLGGRFVYRKVSDKDKRSTPVAIETTKTPTPSTTNPSTTTTTPSTTSTPTPPATATPPVTATPTKPSTTSTTSTAPVAQGVSPAQTPAVNNSAAAASTAIPNTGPASTLALTAIISVGIGSFAISRRRILKNLS